MSEENLKIADIIFAYIKGTITDSELGELTAWMDAAEDHRELFQQIMTSASYQNKETVYRRFDSYYDFDCFEPVDLGVCMDKRKNQQKRRYCDAGFICGLCDLYLYEIETSVTG